MISTKIQEGPNWYTDSKFRRELKRILEKNDIIAVFDIHGRKSEWPTLVDYYPIKYFKEKYTHLSEGKNVMDFKDNDQLTICEEISIPALELEIRRGGP